MTARAALTQQQLADELGVSERTLRDALKKHKIGYLLIGKSKRFDDVAIEQVRAAFRGEKITKAWKERQRQSKDTMAAAYAALDAANQSRNRQGFIYFAAHGDMVKIGFATDVSNRLNTLQTGAPQTLDLLKVMVGGERDERKLHKEFKEYRQRGEWFRLEGRLKAFVERLK